MIRRGVQRDMVCLRLKPVQQMRQQGTPRQHQRGFVGAAHASASAAAQNDQRGRGHRVTVANLRSAKAEL
jgi:hypothetical protein